MLARRSRPTIVVAALCAIVAAGCSSSHHSAAPATSAPAPTTTTLLTLPSGPNTPVDATCALNVATDAITGALGSASAIGWAGNGQGVVTCLGGSFYVGSGINKTFRFGIYTGGPTNWSDLDGYLPAQVTIFRHNGADVSITEFADRVTIGESAFVLVYSRVAIVNPTNAAVDANPAPTAGLVALRNASSRVAPHTSATHDYVVAVDRFGNTYPWPTTAQLATAGSFDLHLAHMRAFWNAQLASIAQVTTPDQQLNDAYESGFIYTQIARSGTHLNTGVNNYASEFSHDVVGILTNLFTQGDYDNAHPLLLEARDVVGAQGQYEDGVWTYSWPWAVYLLKTGDLAFVKANFATSGPGGATQPSIEQTAHKIAADRTGPGGIIGATDDIDTDGLWTVDDYEALTGLAAYRYLAQQIGNATETRWATGEYNSLLAATNRTLTATIARYTLHYLPCSMVQPNTANRCNTPDDANWAAPFLFGRWAWDAELFGASISGPGSTLIDATYDYGFARLAKLLPPDTFGGYPTDFYSTGYNAGYGSWGLASAQHRAQGIESYEFMATHTQSGPYSWWESVSEPPATASPWIGAHPSGGQGSSPHAWGIANANKVLLDSLVAVKVGGALVIGRGIPNDWLSAASPISVANFPTTDGQRVAFTISTTGDAVRLQFQGRPPVESVQFELPAFVNNIAFTTTGTIDEANGTVTINAGQAATVTVQLHHL
jgi:hypothetical protein